MHKELQKEAEKKVKAKKGFIICGIVFFFTSVLLVILSLCLPRVGLWLILPIPALIMVLGIIYVSVFGLPTSENFSDDWELDEVEKEMIHLYRQRQAKSPKSDASQAERGLDLEELKPLSKRERRKDDYV